MSRNTMFRSECRIMVDLQITVFCAFIMHSSVQMVYDRRAYDPTAVAITLGYREYSASSCVWAHL
jgi:hypothetical protein